MAQTTAGISAEGMLVQFSDDGVTWDVDASGFAASVEFDGGQRKVGKGFTFDGDTPLLVKGKRESSMIKVRCVYTEGASEPYEFLRPLYEAGTLTWVNWSPKGGASTEFEYTASGYIVSCPYPGGVAEDENPIFFEVELEVASVTKAVVA